MMSLRCIEALRSGVRRFSTLRSVQLVEVKHEFHDIIKWNKPADCPTWDVQRSCDTKPLGTVDPSTIRLEYRPFADIIERLPDDERRLFTVGMGKRKDIIDIITEDLINLTKRHKYDKTSPEYKVARLTCVIRNHQDIFTKNPRTAKGQMKAKCKEAIQKRRKYLTHLRNEDVKKFEWILPIIGVIFKPLPEIYEPLKRKTCLTKLTDIYCNAIRSKRLFDYKLELESQKLPFLEEKLATLQGIKSDEESMNLPCSVEADIEETLKRIDFLKNNFIEIKPEPQMELVKSFQVPDLLYRVGETKDSVRY